MNHIVHLDIDTFFVSVERILDPKLEGRPVIVGGNPLAGRGVVASCSYEARQFGVHSAQPIRLAHRLCPKAIFLSGNYLHYSKYSQTVSQILKEITPIREQASVDEFYIDLSRTERYRGDAYVWAQEIRKTLNGETHLPISCGFSTNKLISKIATSVKAKHNPERHFKVEPGFERQFLSPLPIRAMPGIGEKMEEELRSFGIDRIGQLAQTEVQTLQRLFGKTGKALSEKSHGIDYSSVVETREQQAHSRQTTFDNTIDVALLFAKLQSLASEVAQDLRRAKKFTSKVSLTLRYSDRTIVSKMMSCAYTNRDMDIYHLAVKLFKKLWTRSVQVQQLSIACSQLLDDLEQQYLFDDAEQECAKVYSVMDLLRAKYSKGIIGFANVQLR
jgi:DNA polymerase-4